MRGGFSGLVGLQGAYEVPLDLEIRQLGLFGLAEMAVFIIILLVGYVYAWKKGALEWE